MASILGAIGLALLIPVLLAIVLILVVIIVLVLVLKKTATVVGNLGDPCTDSTQCTTPLRCDDGHCKT